MKESVGGTQLFIIVVTLVILFAGIMALAINRANSFSVKDKIVNILEKHGGFDMTSELSNPIDYSDCNRDYYDNALEEIACSLQEMSYRQTGKCPDPESGDVILSEYQRNGLKTVGNNHSSFCIYRYPGKNEDGTIKVYYYKVIVFYHLDFPVIKSIFAFRTTGETKALYNTFD